jgi:hypothetical protein
MKKNLIFIAALVIPLICFFIVSEAVLALEWTDRGITEKNRDQTEERTRLFLENQDQKSFVVIYGKNLLTDPVKEQILASFGQILNTYNLPASSIEFKIEPSLFQINLVLSQTGQTIGITNHGLKPSENLIPTISTMFNEFSAWKDLKIKSLQFVSKGNGFQIVITPDQNGPIVDLQFSSTQPRKLIVSDLAVFYNEVLSWKGMQPGKIDVAVDDSIIKATIKDRNGKSVDLTYHGAGIEPKSLNKISNTFASITGWNNIDYKKIMLTAKPDEIDFLVTLNKATYQGSNFLDNIPAGLRLTYNKELNYNFRITSGQYFVQVRGDYTNEEKLLWQINEAIKDPILYIRKYDPEFFFRQLEGIRIRNAEVYDELKSEQQKAYDELLVKHENLKQAHERFIYGFITLQNSGFMGTAEINKQAISRIVELKSANADLTRKQLENQLKQEKVDLSNKVIDMVLSLYFNDFNK